MTFRTIKSALLASAFAGAMVAPAALSQQAQEAAPMPYARADNSWITISGTITKPTANSFLLNYGKGDIIVELDDWDGWNQTMGLKEGDQVQVTGRIDKDLLETTSIEASAVINARDGSRHYSSEADEEDLADWFDTPQSAEFGQTTMRGSVQTVNAAEGEFTLNNGVFEVQVDTGKLADNPLDNEGATQIKVGDIVTVIGVIEDDLFETREIQATSLDVLSSESIQLETSAELQAEAAVQQTAAVQQPVQVAAVEEAPVAPPAQGEASAEATTNVDVTVTLPPEVEMAAKKEGYTTEDLAKAQLAALESAPPLNPS